MRRNFGTAAQEICLNCPRQLNFQGHGPARNDLVEQQAWLFIKSITIAQADRDLICSSPLRLSYMSTLTRALCVWLSLAAASVRRSVPDQQRVGQSTAYLYLCLVSFWAVRPKEFHTLPKVTITTTTACHDPGCQRHQVGMVWAAQNLRASSKWQQLLSLMAACGSSLSAVAQFYDPRLE